MSLIKLSAFAAALIAPAAAGLIATGSPAAAAATGYCLDSGGNTSSGKVPAYLYRDCSSSSANLRWVIEGGQIKNVATGYCLDSGGNTSSGRLPGRGVG
ncbi:hypothetical protein ACWEPC_27785, partial [Nonomuraea sp. NPDC004297]